MVRVTVTTAVRPTEDETKVREAAHRFFPDGAVVHLPGRVAVESRDLRPLRARVWELRIIDTFRSRFQRGAAKDGRSVTFTLSKQAALAGKVSFPPAPHPLGDLEVKVELEEGDPWGDVEALAYWLCPETKDGEIIGPMLP
ncbi:MAG TPA: RNA-binding domain-containing protein [Candidatus Thermoplasmatota archaeon]|nr:RNA-binding domain-containing protein [Candidatus Thermoplasmatota archaeon]